MPQGTRTAAEKVMFDWMLANVNLLYVGLNVLILLDLSTLSRFWTQFEAWLSMQMATVRGLEPAPEAARRCEIIPIHNANDAIKLYRESGQIVTAMNTKTCTQDFGNDWAVHMRASRWPGSRHTK